MHNRFALRVNDASFTVADLKAMEQVTYSGGGAIAAAHLSTTYGVPVKATHARGRRGVLAL